MASRMANAGVSIQIGMADAATRLRRILAVTDGTFSRPGLLPGFEIAPESGGGQFAALAQLTRQRGINRRVSHEQITHGDQLVFVDTR